MPDTKRRGIIHLLLKKDDSLELKNWRPISLLNTDYKICTKVLANRLRNVLPRIINKDQTCGIPDRSIYENLFLLRDTIDYVQHKHLSATIISLDKEKAFDRVNHKFLHRVLTRFNFGPQQQRLAFFAFSPRTRHMARLPALIATVLSGRRDSRSSNSPRRHDRGNSNPWVYPTTEQSVTVR